MLFSRRHALAGGAALATASASIFSNGTEAQQAAVPRRREISTMDGNDPDLIAYYDAVAMLRSAQPNAALSWERIVQIHARFCPHFNWYFLPWHRAYTTMFERIVRRLTGHQRFALPYWDWTDYPSIPAVFLDPGTTAEPNPLYLPPAQRGMTGEMTFPLNATGWQEVISNILNQRSFRAFGSGPADGQDSADRAWLRVRGETGLMETGPHGDVHVMIGNGITPSGDTIQRPGGQNGIMATFVSPRDPLFWMHHCQIDRLWAVWNRNGNANTANPMWLDMNLAGMFLDPDGSVDSNPDSDLNSFYRMQNVVPLGFTYGIGDDLPRLSQPDDELLLAAASNGSSRRRATLGGSTRPTRTTTLSGANTTAATIGKPLEIPVTVAAASIEPALSKPTTPPSKPAAPAAAQTKAPAKSTRAAPAASSAAARRATLVSAPPSTIPQAQAPPPGPRVIARISGIQPPGAGASTTRYRVFVNATNLQSTTPTTALSYVGNFTFFGGDHQEPGQGGHAGHGSHGGHADGASQTLVVDLTRTLNRLATAGSFKAGDPIRVQIVPVGSGDAAQSAITPSRVSISVQ